MPFLRWIYTAPDGNEYPIDVFNDGTCRLYDIEKRRNDTKGTKDPIPVHFSDKLDDLAFLPQEDLNKYSVTFQASPLLLAKLREAKETLSKHVQCAELEREQEKEIDGMFSLLVGDIGSPIAKIKKGLVFLMAYWSVYPRIVLPVLESFWRQEGCPPEDLHILDWDKHEAVLWEMPLLKRFVNGWGESFIVSNGTPSNLVVLGRFKAKELDAQIMNQICEYKRIS